MAVANGGTIAVALGVALVARAADLAPLVALALGALMLLALAQAMTMALLLLGAGAVEAGAGSRRLDGLGGLVHSMPRTAACLLAGAAGLAALPPTAGFAGQWTLFQAVFGAARAGGLGLEVLIAGVVGALALGSALSAAAMVRLVGVALLGRPRTPRASAAGEAGVGTRLAMAGLAGVTVVVGVFPGAVLALAGPALRQLTDASMASRVGLMTVAAQADAPGYVAPAIAVLLAVFAIAALRGVRGGENTVAAWDGGAEPPPPWLPFGDPLTQYGGASMAEPLRRVLGGGGLPAPRFVRRAASSWLPGCRTLAQWPGGAADRAGAGAVRRCRRGADVTAVFSLFSQLLHLVLVLAVAPLLSGLLALLEARLRGRSGPPLLQPWRDLLRLWRKQAAIAENVSWLFRAAPAVAFAAIVVALALVPSFTLGMASAPAADLLAIAGLVMLARCTLALAAMDTGTAFGGIGASRAMFFAAFSEPVLLLVLFAVALLAGSTNADAVAAAPRDGGARASVGLALPALLAVVAMDGGRVGADELAMADAAAALEYSGRRLALLEATRALRLLLWFSLIATLFFPYGIAPAEASPGLWLVGLVAWLAKLLVLVVALAVFRTMRARMRLFRVPELLGVALLLALLAAVLWFVGQRAA